MAAESPGFSLSGWAVAAGLLLVYSAHPFCPVTVAVPAGVDT
jgi:hypothetical protein